MTVDFDILFEVWRHGFSWGLQITLLCAFIPAALSAVWNLLNMTN